MEERQKVKISFLFPERQSFLFLHLRDRSFRMHGLLLSPIFNVNGESYDGRSGIRTWLLFATNGGFVRHQRFDFNSVSPININDIYN